MSKKFEDVWDEVAEELENAKGIAFDGCHKIYVLLDHNQVSLMTTYGYGVDEGTRLVHAIGSSPSEMLETLKTWFNDSCALRFIHAVETNEEDPNEGFTNLIPQGYESEFCSLCENFGADYDGYCEDCRDDEEELEDEEEDEEDED